MTQELHINNFALICLHSFFSVAVVVHAKCREREKKKELEFNGKNIYYCIATGYRR